MIYSISAYNATKYYSNATLFVKNQAKYAVLGLVLMILISKVDYHIYIARFGIGKFRTNLLIIAFVACLGLQGFVLFKGDGTNGSNRWLSLGKFFKLQPSEISKVLIVLLVAYIVYVSPKRLDRMTGFIRVLVFTGPLIVLVAIENLTTALIMAGIVFIVPFVSSRKTWYYVIAFAIVIVAGIFFIKLEGYRAARVQVWRDIENAPGGYQILQGLYAIASGGWFGKGLGNSIQKLGYIPEVHTDMIFTCIVEELGIVGGLFLIAIYVILLVRIFKISANAPDLFGSLIAVGAFTQIALQAILNIAVVTNMIPSTGIPLPFVSYGGSSLVFLMMEMGLVLNVSGKIDYDAAPNDLLSSVQ
ncbi:MAG: cell division protein FtsW [Lachnospiraceae bacterium]|nr:cell division protein FtsW [Lachnospiraceae bacterium]